MPSVGLGRGGSSGGGGGSLGVATRQTKVIRRNGETGYTNGLEIDLLTPAEGLGDGQWQFKGVKATDYVPPVKASALIPKGSDDTVGLRLDYPLSGSEPNRDGRPGNAYRLGLGAVASGVPAQGVLNDKILAFAPASGATAISDAETHFEGSSYDNTVFDNLAGEIIGSATGDFAFTPDAIAFAGGVAPVQPHASFPLVAGSSREAHLTVKSTAPSNLDGPAGNGKTVAFVYDPGSHTQAQATWQNFRVWVRSRAASAGLMGAAGNAIDLRLQDGSTSTSSTSWDSANNRLTVTVGTGATYNDVRSAFWSSSEVHSRFVSMFINSQDGTEAFGAIGEPVDNAEVEIRVDSDGELVATGGTHVMTIEATGSGYTGTQGNVWSLRIEYIASGTPAYSGPGAFSRVGMTLDADGETAQHLASLVNNDSGAEFTATIPTGQGSTVVKPRNGNQDITIAFAGGSDGRSSPQDVDFSGGVDGTGSAATNVVGYTAGIYRPSASNTGQWLVVTADAVGAEGDLYDLVFSSTEGTLGAVWDQDEYVLTVTIATGGSSDLEIRNDITNATGCPFSVTRASASLIQDNYTFRAPQTNNLTIGLGGGTSAGLGAVSAPSVMSHSTGSRLIKYYNQSIQGIYQALRPVRNVFDLTYDSTLDSNLLPTEGVYELTGGVSPVAATALIPQTDSGTEGIELTWGTPGDAANGKHVYLFDDEGEGGANRERFHFKDRDIIMMTYNAGTETLATILADLNAETGNEFDDFSAALTSGASGTDTLDFTGHQIDFAGGVLEIPPGPVELDVDESDEVVTLTWNSGNSNSDSFAEITAVLDAWQEDRDVYPFIHWAYRGNASGLTPPEQASGTLLTAHNMGYPAPVMGGTYEDSAGNTHTLIEDATVWEGSFLIGTLRR